MAMLYDALCGTSYEKESILGQAWKGPEEERRTSKRTAKSVKSILHKADNRTVGAWQGGWAVKQNDRKEREGEGVRKGGSTFNLGESTGNTFCFYILSRLSKTQWSRKLESRADSLVKRKQQTDGGKNRRKEDIPLTDPTTCNLSVSRAVEFQRFLLIDIATSFID